MVQASGVEWSVPTLWPGQTIAVIGSGPSLTPEDCLMVRDTFWPVIVVNKAYELFPWADVLYASDVKFWRQYPVARAFEGMKVTVQCSEFSDLLVLKERGKTGLELVDRSMICTGQNSGYAAMNLAIHFGATRIILLGFDAKGSVGKMHFHEDHVKALGNPSQEMLKKWVNNFNIMLPDLKKSGVEVINASRDTAIKAFKRARLEEVVDAYL